MTEQTEAARVAQKQVSFFEQYLQETASTYFENLKSGNLSIKHNGSDMRPASHFYRFSLGSNGCKYHVLVKVPLLRKRTYNEVLVPGGQGTIERPRISPITTQEIKPELEFTALSEIFEYFNSLDDPRFGAIRVLEYVEEEDAILMEEVPLPTLNQLFLRASRLWFSPSLESLEASFRNSGAWLRLFHQMTKAENIPTRHTKRSEFINSIAEFIDYLGFHLNEQEYFDFVGRTLQNSALRDLPESLPIGLSHGDFAMRNILVGLNSRVTVLDTLARWRSPILEDIGYFLVGLKTARLLVFTYGLAFSTDRLERYRREFLSGYFHKGPIPYSMVRLFESQALLDKWSARLSALKFGSEKNSAFKKNLKLSFLNRHFRAQLDRIVLEVT